MKQSHTVLIIGAGIGGLASACLLAKAGYSVTVYEKEPRAGGRAGQIKQDGFIFDTGPSWYLMPDVFEHFYQLMGTSAAKELHLTKLSPAYKVFFETTDPITITGDIDRDSQTFEQIEPGSGTALKRYVKKSDEIYQLSLKHFLYSNFERASDVLKPSVIANGPSMLRFAFTSIDRYIAGYVRDQRLRQILEYPMVFLGTSPFTAPAIYSLMSALDFKEGVYYPEGGIYSIIESMVRLAETSGVTIHYNTTVTNITTGHGHATGIDVINGDKTDTISGDSVISNGDIAHTEEFLLRLEERTYPKKYWASKEASPSALLLSLGISGTISDFEHHNLLFVDAWRENFESIYDTKKAPEKASIYICNPSKTDASVAPDGTENIFILVPLPAGVSMDSEVIETLRARYLSQIEAMTGVRLQDRIISEVRFGPDDFKTKFYSWQSSMLGQSHKLYQSAFFRTKNKSKKIDNLYYVGASTTPGIGLPMCLIGAELVYKRLVNDHKGGPVRELQSINASNTSSVGQ